MQSVSIRKIIVNPTAIQIAQSSLGQAAVTTATQAVQQAVTGAAKPSLPSKTGNQQSKPTEKQKTEPAKPAKPKQEPPLEQKNTHTEKGGKALTVVGNEKAAEDTVRYHIYYDGRPIERENKGATGFAEFIYYDNNNNAHKLGKSKLIRAKKWKSKNKLFIPHQNTYLIDQRQHQRYQSSDGKVGYEWIILSKDGRFYLSAPALSVVLGALCSLEYKSYRGSGFSTKDGGPGVSTSHLNGINGDFRYLGKNNAHEKGPIHTSYDNFDWEANVKFTEALYKFGYKKFLSYPIKNKNNRLLPHSSKLVGHEHHLHLQGFRPEIIDI